MALASRVRHWLRDETNAVILAAVVVAIPTSYLVRATLEAPFEASFLVLMALGVGVPTIYERWPRRYDHGPAIVWTLVTCLVVVAIFVGVYELLVGSLDDFVASVVTFLIADLGPLGAVALLDRD